MRFTCTSECGAVHLDGTDIHEAISDFLRKKAIEEADQGWLPGSQPTTLSVSDDFIRDAVDFSTNEVNTTTIEASGDIEPISVTWILSKERQEKPPSKYLVALAQAFLGAPARSDEEDMLDKALFAAEQRAGVPVGYTVSFVVNNGLDVREERG